MFESGLRNIKYSIDSVDNNRVICISSGGIFDEQDKPFVNNYTKLTPLRRMDKPVYIIGTTLFLASEASSHMAGQNIMVNGGWTAW